MSNFWNSSFGVITGNEEDAFTIKPKLIPDGTMEVAELSKFILANSEYDGEFYQATWTIMDGDYKGLNIRQKIKAMDNNEEKRHSALNMLKRICILMSFKPTHNEKLNDDDLARMVGGLAGIKIQEWHLNGNDGNWVSEVHNAKGFKKAEGINKPVIETAFSRNVDVKIEDDLPF